MKQTTRGDRIDNSILFSAASKNYTGVHFMACTTISPQLKAYIEGIPKAELHVHIEGTFEPELMFRIAARNGLILDGTPGSHREERKQLQDVHNSSYGACRVLQKERDFYDLMYSYLYRASVDNVYVAEILFNPTVHALNSVPFETVITGLSRALVDGCRDLGIVASLLMCFLPHESEEEILKALEDVQPYTMNIIGIELINCDENDTTLPKFSRVYWRAKELGLQVVAHAHQRGVINNHSGVSQVSRFNLGIQCPNYSLLDQKISSHSTPFTLCPLANEKFQVAQCSSNGKNLIKELLNKGLRVTINSDHPAYLGGYTTDNFLFAAMKDGLTEVDVYNICKSAFGASFIPHGDKECYYHEIDHFSVCMGYKAPAKSITIFGSRAALPGSPDYEIAYNAGKLFASRGFRVVTGGYSGVMAAAAKGATEEDQYTPLHMSEEGGCDGVGCAQGIIAPRVFATRGPLGNPYNTHTQVAHTLVDRLSRLLYASEYFLALGGTIGTITEAFLVWNVASVRPMYGAKPPKIFLWKAVWEVPFKHLDKCISAADMELVRFVDSLEEVLEIVEADIKDRQSKSTL